MVIKQIVCSLSESGISNEHFYSFLQIVVMWPWDAGYSGCQDSQNHMIVCVCLWNKHDFEDWS